MTTNHWKHKVNGNTVGNTVGIRWWTDGQWTDQQASEDGQQLITYKKQTEKIDFSFSRHNKPRYQHVSWNFLNPHVSHQHPTLTQYRPSNCAAQVFLALLLWSYDVGGCFHWLLRWQLVRSQICPKENPRKNPRGRGQSCDFRTSLVFSLHILFNQDGPRGSDGEVRGSRKKWESVLRSIK